MVAARRACVKVRTAKEQPMAGALSERQRKEGHTYGFLAGEYARSRQARALAGTAHRENRKT